MAVDFDLEEITRSWLDEQLQKAPLNVKLVCYVSPQVFQCIRDLRSEEDQESTFRHFMGEKRYLFGIPVHIVETSRTLLEFVLQNPPTPRYWGVWNTKSGWFIKGDGIVFFTASLAVATHQCYVARDSVETWGRSGEYEVWMFRLEDAAADTGF